MRSIALPQAAASQGSQSQRVRTKLGGARVSETATSVGLAIFVYYPPSDCAPRPLQIPSYGISTQERLKSLQPGVWPSDAGGECLLQGARQPCAVERATIQGLIRLGCAPTLQTPTCGRREQTCRHEG